MFVSDIQQGDSDVYIDIYICIFFIFFSIIGHYKIFNIVPGAMQ